MLRESVIFIAALARSSSSPNINFQGQYQCVVENLTAVQHGAAGSFIPLLNNTVSAVSGSQTGENGKSCAVAFSTFNNQIHLCIGLYSPELSPRHDTLLLCAYNPIVTPSGFIDPFTGPTLELKHQRYLVRMSARGQETSSQRQRRAPTACQFCRSRKVGRHVLRASKLSPRTHRCLDEM
jgi:hypothetical protein